MKSNDNQILFDKLFYSLEVFIISLFACLCLMMHLLCLCHQPTCHFILQFSLTLSFVKSWCIWFNEVSSIYGIKSVLKKELISKWLHLSHVSSEIIFKLEIRFSHMVLKSTNLLWNTNDTNFCLFFVFIMSIPIFSILLVLNPVFFILRLFDYIFYSINITV